jgi:hypothetical protein
MCSNGQLRGISIRQGAEHGRTRETVKCSSFEYRSFVNSLLSMGFGLRLMCSTRFEIQKNRAGVIGGNRSQGPRALIRTETQAWQGPPGVMNDSLRLSFRLARLVGGPPFSPQSKRGLGAARMVLAYHMLESDLLRLCTRPTQRYEE